MHLEFWLKEVYPKIVKDLGLDVEKDRISTKIMAELGRGKLLPTDVLKFIKGRDVVVLGPLAKSLDFKWDVLITAGKSILNYDVIPHIHVTDGEEGWKILKKLEEEGCIIVLHAHGDNIELLKEIVPKLGRFVATTQVEPINGVYNFCGFTDGDRAVMIAKHFKARSIRLVGFDFEKADGLKLKKLRWAEYILRMEGII
ncbi:6-hydroxymethylpterin diphosphokinase MptE-like protein [Archaeoglobus sp.]